MQETKTMNDSEGSEKQLPRPWRNTNAAKHGLYTTKSRDRVKAQRIRRKVYRRLEGIPPEIRGVMRPTTVHLIEVEDRLEIMREYLDEHGLVNKMGEPRRLVSEYRQFTKLWLDLASANGMTLASYMSTRRDSLHGDHLALQKWAAGESP